MVDTSAHIDGTDCQRRLTTCPRHRRNEGRVEVKVLREGIDAFRIVSEELRAEESTAKTEVAQHTHLAGDHLEGPVFLTRMEHVDSKAWGHDASIAMLLPVDCKRIEVVALEIHHGEEGIHESAAQPSLGILTHGGVGIPTRTAITAQIVELTDGRAREHDPGLDGFHGPVDLADDIGDILSALIATHLQFPRLRVADIVEMDAIHIVAACYFGAEARQIVARLRHLGIHIALVANLTDEVGKALADLLAAIGVPLANGDGDNPGMALHTALVALVDAELQGIVARRLSRCACDTNIPRLIGTGENGRSPDSGLKHDGIDVGLTELVENGGKFLTLLP